MQGYLSLILHAHLPFIRHPEHERFFEESWLFEAITETYIPLLRLLEGWAEERLDIGLTMTLTPTLCSMLMDPLLQERFCQRLDEWIELAEKEAWRTRRERLLQELAFTYRDKLRATRDYYLARNKDLIGAFRDLQNRGRLEIMTSAATHAVLPFLASHPPSLRAQIMVARDHYQSCFGCEPRGIWLPECAYHEGLENVLGQANLQWFITDTHGILNARPQPRYAVFAPILTPSGLAAFGRDRDSAVQVWSRDRGYPADPRYRDFYRDIGYDLELDYVGPYLPAPGQRGFTGLKYYRISNGTASKEIYDPNLALQAAAEHAAHFLEARRMQIGRLAAILDRPPLIVCPYDAELFGHWWYQGDAFLDLLARKVCENGTPFKLVTLGEYLELHPKHQVASPAASSWGEQGYWQVWLNDRNQWMYPHLSVAQERMTELARRFPDPSALQRRALQQAARELLLAQSSDWAFILHARTNEEYARKRFNTHIARFATLYEQLTTGQLIQEDLRAIEFRDNIFPQVNYRYWAE